MTNFLWSIPLVALLSGCAGKGYVDRQIDPVACRVDVLESQLGALATRTGSADQRANALETRLAALEVLVNQAQLANKAMLDEATAKAADSARRAEAAAASATQASEAAAKIFELGQMK